MSDNYDHYVVSTQCNSQQKAGRFVLAAFLVGIGLYVAHSLVTTEPYGAMFRTTRYANVFGFLFFFACFYSAMIVVTQTRSYCTVYEGHVTGKTLLSVGFWRNSGLASFDLKYDEIENVFEENRTIIIHTRYTSLKVLAVDNRAAALREIRARIEH